MSDTAAGVPPDAPVDAVLFDIDDTVCTYERTTEDLLRHAFEEVAVDPFFSAADYEARYGTFVDESESVEDLRELCFVDIAHEKGRDPNLGREVAQAYADVRDHRNVRWLDGSKEVLDHLGGSVGLAAVTNGSPEMQSQKLDALGVDCFETVVYAGYDTAAKPDPEPFEVALDAVSAESEHAVYVGNSLTSDVAGAHNAGLRAAWIADGETTDPDPQPEYVLDSPRDLLELPWV